MGYTLLKDATKQSNGRHRYAMKGNIRRSINRHIKEYIYDNSYDVFSGSGASINKKQYNMMRYVVVILISAIYLIRGCSGSNIYYSIACIFIISAPREELCSVCTPFGYIIKYLKQSYRHKVDNEIYRAISQLKNISIMHMDKSMRADYIIAQIMKFTEITKPIFSRTLYIWHVDNERKACEYFRSAIGTELGGELANIIEKLDRLKPHELTQQLDLYQENARRVRSTYNLKKNEILSNIIFIPIIASAFVVLLNFVVITVFLDQVISMGNF